MNSYLKINGVLPSGLPYLNLKDLMIISKLTDIGGVVNLFNFKESATDLVGSAQLVGSINLNSDGAVLNANGYIDTQLKESREFTWVVVAKVPTGGVYTPYITTFTHSSVSGDGQSWGNSLPKKNVAVKKDASSDSTSTGMVLPDMSSGEVVVVALTRKAVSGGYQYHVAYKSESVELGSRSTTTSDAPVNPHANVTIGYAPKSGGIIANADVVMRAASVHSVGLNANDLKEVVNNLYTELGVS